MLTVEVQGVDVLSKRLEGLGADLYKVADTAVAKTATKGRRRAAFVETSQFHLGSVFPRPVNGGYETRGTKYSPAIGGYISATRTTSTGKPYRMVNFTFRKTARRTGGKSTADFTSRLASLFGRTATYSKNSPWISSPRYSFRYERGNVRPARSFFSSEAQAVAAAIPEALAATEQRMGELVAERFGRR